LSVIAARVSVETVAAAETSEERGDIDEVEIRRQRGVRDARGKEKHTMRWKVEKHHVIQ
jgi:hypothetical protein